MCGISVALDRAAAGDVPRDLRAMHAPIRHRGPDGEGFLLVGPEGRCRRGDDLDAEGARATLLGMASRRLKILDLSGAAAQPMAAPDGLSWIVFNGEIYNFRELREELTALGRTFVTSGDTEVVLAAWDAWGERALERLDGMWAFVIADLRRRRLVGSRDRFGIKPLYWAEDGRRLWLASEIRQILAARPGSPLAHAPIVAMFLRGERFPCLEETFFEGIRSVPPATWFEVAWDETGPLAPEFRPYWRLADFRCPEDAWAGGSYESALKEFRAALETAVASHDVADVTVGSLLSGGLDSSTLAAVLAQRARAAGRRCPTFSFGVRGAGALSELGYVDAMVRRDGLENHQTGFDAAWVAANAPRVIRTLEEPPLAMPPLAQDRVFELAREHGATVVLDGEGADEVLAGYQYHERALLLDELAHLRLGALLTDLRALARRRARGLAGTAVDYLVRPPVARWRARHPWVAAGYGRRADPDEVSAAERDRGSDPSRVQRQLHYDVRWGNLKIVLGYTDKTAMAHSVEARVPYLDRRLVELAFSLPARYKVGRGDRKRILRDVARGLIPAEITERADRMGFAMPDGQMLRGAMWPAVAQIVRDRSLLDAPCLSGRAAARLIDDFESGRSHDHRAIWRLYALALWREQFDVRFG